ncbi:hypothetical protein L1887_33272 [Cichorium endivia]|nr:hypothetical protein L1887_33272 [Cichorium endivia]
MQCSSVTSGMGSIWLSFIDYRTSHVGFRISKHLQTHTLSLSPSFFQKLLLFNHFLLFANPFPTSVSCKKFQSLQNPHFESPFLAGTHLHKQ